MEGGKASRSEATFRYKIKNVSKLNKTLLKFSPSCYVQNLPWKIVFLLTFDETPKFGFYLRCKGKSESTLWSCNAAAELRLLSCKPGRKYFKREIKHLFCSAKNYCGYKNFRKWQDVLDPKKGYIKKDSITLEVHIVADAPVDVGLDSNGSLLLRDGTELNSKKEVEIESLNISRSGEETFLEILDLIGKMGEVTDRKLEKMESTVDELKNAVEKLERKVENFEVEKEERVKEEEVERKKRVVFMTKVEELKNKVEQWQKGE